MAGNNVSPVIVTDAVKGSPWLNKLRNQVIASRPQSSSDIEVKEGPDGSTFHLQPHVLGLLSLNYKFLNELIYSYDIPSNTPTLNQLDFVALINTQVQTVLSSSVTVTDSAWWNEFEAYSIGDERRMQNAVDGGINPDTGNSVTTVPGTWVCVSPVPYDYTAAQLAVINSIENADIKALALAATRQPGVNYWPIWDATALAAGTSWAEPRQIAHKTTNGKGRYWELIGTFNGAGGSGTGLDVWLT